MLNALLPTLLDAPRAPTAIPLESFSTRGDGLVRTIRRRNGDEAVSHLRRLLGIDPQMGSTMAFDASWIRSAAKPQCAISPTQIVRIADLFSGCGGLSLGAYEACRALGISPRFEFACDLYSPANEVYAKNFEPAHQFIDPIEMRVGETPSASMSTVERALVKQLGDIDLVVSGPPCQGHSDLNNHTRRTDPKNRLVLRVARFAELFRPTYVLIENVRGIRHDKLGALAEARRHLERMKYHVTEHLLSADTVGVPQSRRRHFLFASLLAVYPLEYLTASFENHASTVRWAIEDLVDTHNDTAFDTASTPTPANRRRIEYLHAKKVLDLPNAERPRCHQDGQHSYKAVYGRLRWDEPAPTITTGFGCMGQGRFVHPSKKRTLTPHEAARLQFFPDFFDFGERKRGEYQQLIGNAVPPKLAYAILLHQLA